MADQLTIELAWELGRASALEGRAEFLDDGRHVRPDPPRLSYRERVARRIAEMEACALRSDSTWRGQYPGGPVDWETGRVIS